MKTTRTALAATLLVSGAILLTGCSTDSGATADSPSASPSASEETRVGDPSTWTPEDVTPGDSIPAVVGQYLVLDGLPDIAQGEVMTAETSDDAVIWLSQVGPEDYAMVRADGPGEASVNLYYSAGEGLASENTPVATFNFVVRDYNPSEADPSWEFNDEAPMGSDPATWSPVQITPDSDSVEMTAGQFGLVSTGDVAFDTATIMVSSDPSVVAVAEDGPAGTGMIQAEKPGKAVLTVVDTDGVGEFMKVQVLVLPVPNGS